MTTRKGLGADAKEVPNTTPKYLHCRSGIYYFKRKIPVDVTTAFPNSKRIKLKSLGLREYEAACLALAAEVLAFESRCAEERAKKTLSQHAIDKTRRRRISGDRYLLAEHIPIIIKRLEHSSLGLDDFERDELARNGAGNDDAIDALLEQRCELLKKQLACYKRSAVLRRFSVANEVVVNILQADRLIAPPGSKLRQELVEQVLAKQIEVLMEQLQRLEGLGKPTPPEREYPPEPRALPTLGVVHLSWSKTQGSKTSDTYKLFVDEFETAVGAIPLVSLRKEHAIKYRDWLAAELSLKLETVKNRFGGLGTLVRYAQKELVPGSENVFENVLLTGFDKTEAHEERRQYRPDELQHLFLSELYAQHNGAYRPNGQTQEALHWSPLIGAFAGLRIEEVAQLRVSDIEYLQGSWTFVIAEGQIDQHLKTLGSIRWVPVHAELIRCGFIEYVDSQRRKPTASLFPSLRNHNKHNRWAAALSKRYGAYLDRIGLNDPRLDFQSFRYSFKQQCTLCGISGEARDALAGHWLGDGNAGLVYLKRDGMYPFPALVEAMQKLSYQGLDLSHLYRPIQVLSHLGPEVF